MEKEKGKHSGACQPSYEVIQWLKEQAAKQADLIITVNEFKKKFHLNDTDFKEYTSHLGIWW